MPGLGRPRVRALPLALIAICSLLAPAGVLAHGAGQPFIHVPADHIEQGRPFTVVAADLGENARVTVQLTSNDLVVPLGTTMAGPDGHFETSLVVPDSFPDGYAQLIAQADDGSRATVWVRVGEGPDLSLPAAPLWADWRVDPLLILIVAASALLMGVLFAALRHRSRSAG